MLHNFVLDADRTTCYFMNATYKYIWWELAMFWHLPRLKLKISGCAEFLWTCHWWKVDNAKDDACSWKAYTAQTFELRPQWWACINLPCWNVWMRAWEVCVLCMSVWVVKCFCVHVPVLCTECAKSNMGTHGPTVCKFCFVWTERNRGWHRGLGWSSACVWGTTMSF